MNKIVFKGETQDGIPYLIRYPKRTDLQELWLYINKLSKEQTYISFQGEEISLKDERVFLNSSIKKIKEGKAILLIVQSNKKIIGVSDVNMRSRSNSHIGVFGISVSKDFRGKGVGKKLMELVINESKKNLKNLRILELECFANNPIAPDLYKSFGFKEYGRLPNGIAYKDGFVDDILMYYEVKS